MMFDTGGTSATRTGETLLRYYRDASMFRTHIAAQYDAVVALHRPRLLRRRAQPLTPERMESDARLFTTPT